LLEGGGDTKSFSYLPTLAFHVGITTPGKNSGEVFYDKIRGIVDKCLNWGLLKTYERDFRPLKDER
jgi:hypothetical protein